LIFGFLVFDVDVVVFAIFIYFFIYILFFPLKNGQFYLKINRYSITSILKTKNLPVEDTKKVSGFWDFLKRK